MYSIAIQHLQDVIILKILVLQKSELVLRDKCVFPKYNVNEPFIVYYFP